MNATVLQVGVLLFTLGLGMVVLRGQLLAMLLGIELMVGAVNVILTYHANLFGDPKALAAVVLIICVAAAEAVLGLCLILKLHHGGIPAETESLAELRD
ncbi:MAG: NADH-quinone oxidoreductase subunit K [Elusimicrobia bacterium]|nr:NADH-quinone oxidoreductase subunit K [Elusimicrobiota bacterium]